MITRTALIAGALLALPVSAISAQGGEQQVQDLKKEIEQLRNETDEAIEDLEDRLARTAAAADSLRSGTTDFLLTGYAAVGFENAQGEDSTFGASFSPIFIWRLQERLLFEGEIEFEFEDDEAEFDVEYAQLVYTVNDHLSIGAGKFLNPANYFMERLHPAWINKLPNAPLPFHGARRILSPSQLGVQARGAADLGSTRLEYALFLSNGPTLITDEADGEPGTLVYDNYSDLNNSKCVGGRIGVFPLAHVELGYGFEFARVDPSGFDQEVDEVTHIVDLNIVKDSDAIGGTVDVRVQAVWLNIDDATYTTTSGPLTYDNKRNGGYAQVAYRPSKLENAFLQNLEGVVRFDWINVPSGALTPVDEKRITIGLNYWFGPSSVVKLAFMSNNRDVPSGTIEDEDAVMVQFGVGF